MNIDQNDGTVRLPNGNSISPSLSQDAFRQSAMFHESPLHNPETSSWIYHHVSGGTIDGHELTAFLCFYGQTLVSVELAVNLGVPAPSGSSPDLLELAAAAVKQFHNRLLERIIGPPSSSVSMPFDDPSPSLAMLARQLTWDFPWGKVISHHNFYSHMTCIGVTYGDRYQQAFQAWTSARAKTT
jgi:hypothetical protein